MKQLLVLVIVLVTSFRCSESQQAGVKFRLNPNGVKVFNDIGFREATRIGKTSLNDLRGSVSNGDGRTLEYEFTNNEFNDLEFLGSKTTNVMSPKYLFVVGDDAFVEADGDLTLSIRNNGVLQQTISVKYFGAIFNGATGVVFETTISGGYLKLKDIQCRHAHGVVGVSLGVTQEPGITLEEIENALKNHLVQQVCDVFIPKLTSRLNEVFMNTPLFIDLTGSMNGTRVDFALLPEELSIVDNQFLFAGVTGRVYPASNPNVQYPYQISEFPEFSSTSQMAQVLISDYHMRTLFQSLHDSGLLEFRIPESSIPKILGQSAGSLLSLLVPSFRQYVNMPLTFIARSTEVPTFNIDENSIKVNGSFDVSLVVQLATGENFEAMAIDARFTGVGDVIVTGNTIGINLEDVRFDLELARSNIGSFSFNIIGSAIKGILPTFVRPTINELLNQGITIPSFLTMELYNLKATKRQNALEVTTDLRIN